MPTFTPGDHVKIASREQTSADIKSSLYFPHYAGLTGTILKLYGEEASVLVDRTSLPDEVRNRHNEGENAMRQRWLDGLSEEARNRMGSKEKQFNLNYAVLVALSDLSPDAGGEEAAKRTSESDLNAAEEAFLKERGGKSASNGTRNGKA